jgi:anti-sigma factor RsiW
MKDHQELLKLQAFLDGELPKSEAGKLAAELASDPEATALVAELRSTREVLKGFEESIKLSESREFYWSKIERAIQSEEKDAPTVAAVGPVWLANLRRILVPAAGLAVLAIVGLLATQSSRIGPGSIETAFSDPGALTYHDYTSGTTLVWLSYPAENDLAPDEDETTLE